MACLFTIAAAISSLPDAESDADLDAIARRYAHEPAPLWCGAAGLARALAQRPPRTGRPLGAPHLVIIGSRHPVSLRQIEVAAAARPEWFAPLAESGFEARVQTTLGARGRCIVLPALPPGLSEMEAVERIARGVERLAERLPPPAALTVVGGETFAAVCRVLKATWLSVDGEFLPGIPASRMEFGTMARNRLRVEIGRFRRAGLALEPSRLEHDLL